MPREITRSDNQPSQMTGYGALDKLFTVREAAAVLSISVPTFWRRVADGTIAKPVKLGGLSRWPSSEIIDVIETAKNRRAP